MCEAIFRRAASASACTAEGNVLTDFASGRGLNSRSLAAITAPTMISAQASATDQWNTPNPANYSTITENSGAA